MKDNQKTLVNAAKSYKRRILIVLGIVLVLILVLIVYFISRYRFSQNRWESDVDSRKLVVDDVVENYLPDMSREEVTSLLGSNGLVYEGEDNITYEIGWGFIDPMYLTIYFDENDIYVESLKTTEFYPGWSSLMY